MGETSAAVAPAEPRLERVMRRGPILRPSRGLEGVYGLDLTAGCLIGCPFCHIRGSRRDPGGGRVRFDPLTALGLDTALDDGEGQVRRVVFSPFSDPLPRDRAVRAEATRVVDRLLGRGVEVVLMTRGRIPKALMKRMTEQAELCSVAVGLTTMSKTLMKTLEPGAATPVGRLRDLRRLAEAGIDVEVRLEPMIAGLTDIRENLVPLFRALAQAGVRRLVTHYLFLVPNLLDRLAEDLAPLGWSERLRQDFENGPVFPVGSIGNTKHYPRDLRREGLARMTSWAAEHGLTLTTGAGQNPDMPRPERPRARERPMAATNESMHVTTLAS